MKYLLLALFPFTLHAVEILTDSKRDIFDQAEVLSFNACVGKGLPEIVKQESLPSEKEVKQVKREVKCVPAKRDLEAAYASTIIKICKEKSVKGCEQALPLAHAMKD